jgi:acyl-CoA thioester hydrolase
MGCVVNNAVYLQYLEHSKCEWLKTMNINYAALANKGQFFVVSKLNIDFKFSLKYDDDFWIGMNARRPSNYHLEGEQDIYRSDGKTILLSRVVVVCMQGQEIHKLPQTIIDKYPLIKHAESAI